MQKFLQRGFLIILALLPVHALLSVWLTSNFGFDNLFAAWKEVLLAILALVTLWVLKQKPKLREEIFNRRINQLILLYLVLHLLLWLVTGVELDAAVAGLLINLRFLAMFVLGQILVVSSSKIVVGVQSARGMGDGSKSAKELQVTAGRVVLAGGMLVSVFGALQLLVLPADFLTHFGYGPDTIAPYRTIDENADFMRINSTLRGPNPLGLYLILVLPLLVAWAMSKLKLVGVSSLGLVVGRNQKRSQKASNWPQKFSKNLSPIYYLLIPAAALLTLYGSHSRSGWLGALIAVSWLTLCILKPAASKLVSSMGIGLALILFGITLLNWQSNFIQHTVLHRDPNQGIEVNSNDAHWRANRTAISDIVANPFGSGPGSAGPASFYNAEKTSIAENYFLQIGQEVGVIGLVLFLWINWLVASALWRQKNQLWPLLLLASFMGITVANFFLHAWAQDETALIWWGLAGLFYKE